MSDTIYPKPCGHVDLGPDTFLAIVEQDKGWFAVGYVNGDDEQTLMVTDNDGLLTLSNLFIRAAMPKKVDDE